MLVDVALHAREVWPGMDRTLTHAGAPVAWKDMCGPMQGSMIGAALYEGWAESPEEAAAMLERGDIALTQGHDRAAAWIEFFVAGLRRRVFTGFM